GSASVALIRRVFAKSRITDASLTTICDGGTAHLLIDGGDRFSQQFGSFTDRDQPFGQRAIAQALETLWLFTWMIAGRDDWLRFGLPPGTGERLKRIDHGLLRDDLQISKSDEQSGRAHSVNSLRDHDLRHAEAGAMPADLIPDVGSGHQESAGEPVGGFLFIDAFDDHEPVREFVDQG